MREEERSKVISVHIPGRERRRTTIFLGALAVLLLILAFFAVEGGRNWDAVHRFFTYGSGELRFELDTDADKLTDLEGNLVTVGAEGITAYTEKGTVNFMAMQKLESPVVLSGSETVLAYEAGGENLLLLNRDGGVLLELNTDGTIFDADLAKDGSACYVSTAERIRSVLQVYDKEQLPCYTVNSASRYFSGCAVSENAEYVCVIALGQENGLFASYAVIYRTDREEPVAELCLGGQLVYDVTFWGSNRICALGEESVTVLTTDGKLVGQVACEGVRSFDLGGDGFAALVMPGSTGYDLITVNRGARIVGTRSLGDAEASVDVSGKYVACLTDGGLTISGQKLDPWFVAEDVGFANKVCMSDAGVAYLLTGTEATRFLP